MLAALVAVVVGFLAITVLRKPSIKPDVAATSTPTVSVGEQFLGDANRHLKAGNFEAAAREFDDAYSFFSAKGDSAKTKRIAVQRKEAKLKLARQHLQFADKALKSRDAIRAAAQAEAAVTLFRGFGGTHSEIAQAVNVKRAAEVTHRPIQATPEPVVTATETPSIDTDGTGYKTHQGGGHTGHTQPPVTGTQPVQQQTTQPKPQPPPRPVTPPSNENWREKFHRDDATRH